jgi:hypothetical protein
VCLSRFQFSREISAKLSTAAAEELILANVRSKLALVLRPRPIREWIFVVAELVALRQRQSLLTDSSPPDLSRTDRAWVRRMRKLSSFSALQSVASWELGADNPG